MPLSNSRSQAEPEIAGVFSALVVSEATIGSWRQLPEEEKRQVKRRIHKMLAERPEMSAQAVADTCQVVVKVVHAIQRGIARRSSRNGVSYQRDTDHKRIVKAIKRTLKPEDIAKYWTDIAKSGEGAQRVRALERISEYLGASDDKRQVLPVFILPSDAAIEVYTERPTAPVSTATVDTDNISTENTQAPTIEQV